MHLYPLFLDLTNKDVLVVGAGKVGQRKIASLLETPVRNIIVLDLNEAQKQMLPDDPRIDFAVRSFNKFDVPGIALVFAATNSAQINSYIAATCTTHGVLCNSATQPTGGDFFLPACVHQDDLTVAISTGGHSPALSAKIRKDLEAWIGNRYTPILTILHNLRPLLLELNLPTEENAVIFRRIISELPEDIFESTKNDRNNALIESLCAIIPVALHSRIKEITHEL